MLFFQYLILFYSLKFRDDPTDERVQITSVNGGKNYIVDEEAAAEIGMIWRTEIWDDVTVPGNLLTKARTRLHDLAQGVTSMELTIVDESDTGADSRCPRAPGIR